MLWKSLFANPKAAFCWLTVCVTLLVDFQKAATKVAEFLPAGVRAFFPLVVIGAFTYFSLSLIQATPSLVRWIKSRRPSGRFTACHSEIYECLEAIIHAQDSWKPLSVYRLHQIIILSKTLRKFGISCPNLQRFALDESMAEVWFKYLFNLSVHSQTGNLEAARMLMDSLGLAKYE